ncbi:MAG: hypothetical protein ACK5LV_07435 [Lachnospirales bacterium]
MRKIITFSIVCVLVVGVFFRNAYATSAGSQNDPIVTKSYVDEQIALALSGNTGSNSGGSSNLTLTNSQLQEIINAVTEEVLSSQSSSASFVPIRVTKGQTVIGGQGTEIILRSGEAKIFSNAADGVSNITKGANQDNGEKVVLDNLLLVPRQDGRGITITTNEAWIMIKGEYEIIG